MKKVSDPPDDPFSARVRARSGFVDYNDTLTSFLYLLVRDHLPAGVVEHMMIQIAKEDWLEEVTTKFTNGWLATYAHDVALRLKDIIPNPPKPKTHVIGPAVQGKIPMKKKAKKKSGRSR